MRLRSILFFNISAFLFAFALILVTIANNNPFDSNFGTFTTFYIGLLLTLWSAITLIIYFIKSRVKVRADLYSYWPTLRQAFFLSVSLTVILLLRGLRIFDWWIGVSIIIAFSLLELFFNSKRKKI